MQMYYDITFNRVNKVTGCKLTLREHDNYEIEPDYHLIQYAHAYCNPKDQFVKEIGRIISLGRAISQMEFEIWAGNVDIGLGMPGWYKLKEALMRAYKQRLLRGTITLDG